MIRPIKIIQCSTPHTGSTLLLNLIHGVLAPNEATHWNTETYIDKYMITKTHNININEWINNYPYYELYFIVSERENHTKIDNRYYNYKNVLVIDYNDINITENNSLMNVSKYITKNLKNFLPKHIFPKIDERIIYENVIKRINDMNELYEKIKDKSFNYCDLFYGLHGHHRNRNITY